MGRGLLTGVVFSFGKKSLSSDCCMSSCFCDFCLMDTLGCKGGPGLSGLAASVIKARDIAMGLGL
jgi:hypothetical protein